MHAAVPCASQERDTGRDRQIHQHLAQERAARQNIPGNQGMRNLPQHAWLMSRTEQQHAMFLLCQQVAGYGNKYIRGEDKITRISPDQIQQSVDDSLKRLGTDHIDLLQVSR